MDGAMINVSSPIKRPLGAGPSPSSKHRRVRQGTLCRSTSVVVALGCIPSSMLVCTCVAARGVYRWRRDFAGPCASLSCLQVDGGASTSGMTEAPNYHSPAEERSGSATWLPSSEPGPATMVQLAAGAAAPVPMAGGGACSPLDVADEQDLCCDTMVALQLLVAQFPSDEKVWPCGIASP